MSQFSAYRNGTQVTPQDIALIGVGANLPGPRGAPALETCQQAVALLDLIPGMRLCGLSRWFRSAPVPPSGQPDYVNAVAALVVDRASKVNPALLLARLMAIEAAFARQRASPNAARTLDLDIIGIGDVVRQAPDPILPHPRAHLRAFVLAPLADVAPAWIHPILQRTAAEMLADLPLPDARPI